MLTPGYINFHYADAMRDAFDERNATLLARQQQIDIVQMGDSITCHWNLQPLFPGKTVVNNGISGDQTHSMRLRFAADVLQLQPTYCLLLGGINDLRACAQHESPYQNHTFAQICDEIVENLCFMCEQARFSQVNVILQAILPHEAAPLLTQTLQDGILTINASLAAYCKEQQIPFLNYHDILADSAGLLNNAYTADGLHLNSTGYEVIQQQLLKTDLIPNTTQQAE